MINNEHGEHVFLFNTWRNEMVGVIEAVSSADFGYMPGSKMPIWINSGRCGSGKTWKSLERLASRPIRAVFVTDRIEVMADRARLLADAGRRAGRKPVILTINSQSQSNLKGSVRQQIETAGRELSAAVDHAIVLITHESMKAVDWSAFFGDWEIVIDEAPSMFSAGRLCTTGSRSFWSANFALQPVGTTGWSKLGLTADAVSPAALESDTFLNEVSAFRRRVKAGTVYASITDWDQTEVRAEWSWISIWNPLELSGFSRVTILANQFESTMTSILIDRFFGDRVEFLDANGVDERVWVRRNLNIGYFVDDQRGGSTSFWLGIGHRTAKTKSDDGKAVLRRIGAWLEKNSPADHIMMFNALNGGLMADVVGASRVPGCVLSPRQAGSNDWQHVHCVTSIYSSKPNGFERHLFETIGVSADEVRRAREYEDLLQFVFRSSIRDPNSSETVEVRVYDIAQAEFLARFFADDPNGYVDVTVYPITDAGVLTVQRPRSGRKTRPGNLSADGRLLPKAVRQAAYRERLKAEKLAAGGGPPRPRGRPKASSSKPPQPAAA